jgi:predicted dehydrogenase
MRLGLIGCGRWGRNIISTSRDLLDAKLVAVARANSGTACTMPENCCVFPDWRSLLDSNLIDGVIIASPAYTHAEIALAAMERHIPVLIEKPMALSIDDAEALLKSSIKNQTYATVDHIHLFNPAFRRMVEIMPTYGSILNISGIAGGPGPYRSDCSALWDWAPHDISMILTLTKKIFHQLKLVKNKTNKILTKYLKKLLLKEKNQAVK